ncbi:acetyl-coenzyme A synthetase N-terminal domain-containing protein [Variovorax ureilyticus]|uniref:acetyl-coenzyme A synthetase N-terminal domain-containing protein n=1 Tax=Variovorax ureilyticus TaxID=1836198 RepID=UPI003BF55040
MQQPDTFWAAQARLIDWHVERNQIRDSGKPPFARSFIGGQTNLCHNAVDHHTWTSKPTARRSSGYPLRPARKCLHLRRTAPRSRVDRAESEREGGDQGPHTAWLYAEHLG